MNHKKAISAETVQYIIDNSASKSIDSLIKDTGLSEHIVSRVIRDTIGKKPVTPKYRGCDEDCFNCPYKDCYRPVQKMTDDVQGYFKAEKQREKRIRDILNGKITWDGKNSVGGENMKTVYIAGKITGEPNYKRYFDAAKRLLQQQGYAVMSPADLPAEGFTYQQYMRICKVMLQECDSVCLLPNWIDSNGAKAERNLAYALGKRVVALSWADIGEADSNG